MVISAIQSVSHTQNLKNDLCYNFWLVSASSRRTYRGADSSITTLCSEGEAESTPAEQREACALGDTLGTRSDTLGVPQVRRGHSRSPDT